jgi:hypothetical protein
MSFLVDDAARILASPMPRRQAISRLGALLFGSVVAGLGVRPAAAQTCRPECKGGDQCCPGNYCLTNGRLCCGNSASTACLKSEVCCSTIGGGVFCSSPGHPGATGAEYTSACCAALCNSSQKCCTYGTAVFCCPKTSTCGEGRCSSSSG